MDPFMFVIPFFVQACTHGVFGNACDAETRCLQFQNMIQCHEQYFGDIHTPAYMQALREGHNPGRRPQHRRHRR